MVVVNEVPYEPTWEETKKQLDRIEKIVEEIAERQEVHKELLDELWEKIDGIGTEDALDRINDSY